MIDASSQRSRNSQPRKIASKDKGRAGNNWRLCFLYCNSYDRCCNKRLWYFSTIFALRWFGQSIWNIWERAVRSPLGTGSLLRSGHRLGVHFRLWFQTIHDDGRASIRNNSTHYCRILNVAYQSTSVRRNVVDPPIIDCRGPSGRCGCGVIGVGCSNGLHRNRIR